MITDPQVLPFQIEKELSIEQSESFSDNSGSWQFTKSLNECVKDADAIVILTAWEEYKKLKAKNKDRTNDARYIDIESSVENQVSTCVVSFDFS